ncbi:MAG: biotin/lipoyl-containing protein [Chloroflexota bacterium]|nr:biotin/lipoyl-containing protein [Chloroflexota bacterium]
MRYVTGIEDKTFVVEVGEGEVTIDGQTHTVDMRRIEPLSLYSLLVDNLSYETFIEQRGGEYGVVLRGKLYTVQVQEEHACQQTAPCLTPPAVGGEVFIEAPLPGLVVEMHATIGQTVRAGEALLVLESMKMRTDLCSPQDGVIQEVRVAARDQVDQGQVLLTLSTESGA